MQRNKNKGQPVHHRSKYVDHSLRFVDWVNGLGLEQTFLGRMAQLLDKRFMLRRLALLFLFSLALSFLLMFDVDFVYTGFRDGDIASIDVKSPITFDFVDEIETKKKKFEAENSVPLVFDLHIGLYDDITNGIYRGFREMRRLLANEPWPRKESERLEAIKSFLVNKPRFEQVLGQSGISESTFEWLVSERFNVQLENAVVRLLERLTSKRITRDVSLLRQEGREKMIVRVVEDGGGGQEFTADTADVMDVSMMRRYLASEDAWLSRNFSKEDRERIFRFLDMIVAPNLTLNKHDTAIRQGKAREAVLPVVMPIKKNQVIIREGAVIQPMHILLLDEIKRLRSEQRRDFIALVMAGMFVAMMLIFLSYLRRFTTQKVKVTFKDMLAMGTVTMVVVMICKLLLFMTASAFEERFHDLIPPSAYVYLMPMAAGPMLVGLLVSSGEVVWLFTLFLSAVLALMVDQSFAVFIVSIVGGVAGARGVYNCKKRNDIYLAGLRTGAVNMVIIACVTIITSDQQEQLLPLLAWNVPAGLAAGILASLIAMMLIPLFETVFNYSTDVKLLELSNLNHPLLREMIVKAPGTYHHSLVVGSMVEAAAEEIGANPLLAKVSAYYHDIGKTEHAGYFIENQRSGYNPHDHISPHMSKTVLIAHVKDGVELGGKFNLGQPIIDVILQHHGTTLISYFYHKAKQSEDVSLYSVSEDEFRYPGPKPQFKEAALCMLADSIEAAARCLDEPQPVRLQNIVKNIIHSKFMDGQLDECNLTLKDLSIIENSFNRILLGIYHQRIDYPAGKKPSEPSPSSKKPIASA